MSSDRFSTTDSIPGKTVRRNFGIVTSNCVMGINLFRDIAGQFRDVIGGRSKTHQKAMAEAQRVCFEELSGQAKRLGANAVVGVSLDFEELGGGGKAGMVLLAAAGTAVEVQ